MSPVNQTVRLIGALKAVMVISLAGSGVMLVIAWCITSLDGVTARILLTFVALLFGSLLMQVQLRQGHRRGNRLSRLLCLGVAVIAVSQISFLTLVWTHWTARRFVWQIWWISMVPSVFVTHLLLIRSVRPRGVVQHVATVCIVWAGLMILLLGLREDMFGAVSPVYLWVGSIPAAGTVICSLVLTMRRVLLVPRPRRGRKRNIAAGVLMSLLVVAVAAFYIGRATSSGDPDALVKSARSDVREQIGRDRYAMQSRLAEYLGDTRILKREPYITVKQIEEIQGRLRPGDILLERRNWYASNWVLPGFWPHAALYVGSVGDIEKLGVLNHPAIRKHLAELCLIVADGRQRVIIEAVSEGVVLMAATHSLHADYVAVLRPRLSRDQVALAIVRAFERKGKDYDFDFDFDDREKLVCTQLVYEAYSGMLDFKLVRIAGRNTLPALEVARKYANEYRGADRQLDFVLFLDAVPAKHAAREATEADFIDTISRPSVLAED